MDLNVVTGSLPQATADTVVVSLFQGVRQPGGAARAVDEATGGAVTRLIEAGDFSGRLNQVAVLYPPAGGGAGDPDGAG